MNKNGDFIFGVLLGLALAFLLVKTGQCGARMGAQIRANIIQEAKGQ